MTTFPRSPRLSKGGIVLVDPETAQIIRMISLQYNPQSLSRSFQVKGAGGDGGGRSEPLRLKGPPVETYKLEAEIDAADQLEFPKKNAETVQYGISPILSALETIIYPDSEQLAENNTAAMWGTIEIAPAEAPLTMFIWNKYRVMPVRLTELSVNEEAFDPFLNPIRAKVSLSMRVLSVDDLGFNHLGASYYLAYQQQKEQLTRKLKQGS